MTRANTTSPSSNPVFELNPDGSWSPGPLAKGPFSGVQGGAAAALMSHAVQGVVGEFISSVTTHFLKPAPLDRLRVRVVPLRTGRRVSIVDAELSSGGDLVAVQRSTVIAPRTAEALPTPPQRPSAPDSLPRHVPGRPRSGPWFMDSMDVRAGPDGRIWFRQRTPLFGAMTGLSRVLAAADWAHGLAAPIGAEARPDVGIPNPDVTVHLFRSPRGDWTGVDPASAWSHDAVGTGWGALHDMEGLIGRVAMSIAITPLETGRA